ncbi:MAG: rhomboid family intramembrane serine protease [Devosia sp.]
MTPSRFPGLTLAVFLATAAVTAASLYRPEIATGLERNAPLIAEGQVWRLVTTWLVETDGWAQIAVNFAGLAIFGWLVETFVGRRWWIIGYVVAGLAGEIAGLWWQPLGGGNSVAVCGLIGVFSLWQVLRQTTLGARRFVGPIFWLGLGLFLVVRRDIHGAALVAGFIVGALAFLRPKEARHA